MRKSAGPLPQEHLPLKPRQLQWRRPRQDPLPHLRLALEVSRQRGPPPKHNSKKLGKTAKDESLRNWFRGSRPVSPPRHSNHRQGSPHPRWPCCHRLLRRKSAHNRLLNGRGNAATFNQRPDQSRQEPRHRAHDPQHILHIFWPGYDRRPVAHFPHRSPAKGTRWLFKPQTRPKQNPSCIR